MRILLTTTSYQDTPGPHHDLLAQSGHTVVRARGPIHEDELLKLIAEHKGFDGFLCGDDAITAKVIDAALAAPTKLRVIAKYGIGLDSIDVTHATSKKIPVLFTPGVNHTTVAEHAIGLMVAVSKHFNFHLAATRKGEWKRKTGRELAGKTLGVIGAGRIGREVMLRAKAMGMSLVAYDPMIDKCLPPDFPCKRVPSAEDVLREADVVSLHVPATDETKGFINAKRIEMMRPEAILINTARGSLVDEDAVLAACKSGRLYGYGTDVVNVEPPPCDHPFFAVDNIIVTPHVGSRTLESVQRQADRATRNILNYLKGDKDFIQANTFT
ncbi:MAG: 3-phosphoglycerate dehydrogenase [Phycisphaera sp.]|nr:3-phosphoglycerate dehydrogenase [Phycisphaera sp.]